MRLTPEQFEARAFFTVLEVVRAAASSGVPGYTVRRWLHRANAVQTNDAGAKIVTRVRLETGFPELLEGIRRCVVMGLGVRRARRVGNGGRASPHHTQVPRPPAKSLPERLPAAHLDISGDPVE